MEDKFPIWLSRDKSGYQGVHAQKPTYGKGLWSSPMGREMIPSSLFPGQNEAPKEFIAISRELFDNLMGCAAAHGGDDAI